jgi:short-subunit dehydrogenase
MQKILFVTNVDWFFISHRLVIAEEAYKSGYDVFLAAEDTGRSQEIIDTGIKELQQELKIRVTLLPCLDISVEENTVKLIDIVEKDLGSVDILINNAAQTVRRPPQFYLHLIKEETKKYLETTKTNSQICTFHSAKEKTFGV